MSKLQKFEKVFKKQRQLQLIKNKERDLKKVININKKNILKDLTKKRLREININSKPKLIEKQLTLTKKCNYECGAMAVECFSVRVMRGNKIWREFFCSETHKILFLRSFAQVFRD